MILDFSKVASSAGDRFLFFTTARLPACKGVTSSPLGIFDRGPQRNQRTTLNPTLNPSQPPNTPCDRVHSPPLFPPPSFVQITFFIHPDSFHLLFNHPSPSTYTLPGNANNAFVRGCGQDNRQELCHRVPTYDPLHHRKFKARNHT